MDTRRELQIEVSQAAGFADAEGPFGAGAKEAFETLGDVLADALAPLRQKLGDAAAAADQIEVKLDLGLKAGGKWVVVSMEGSATVSVKLVWNRKP